MRVILIFLFSMMTIKAMAANNTNPETTITVTGAVFTLETTHPQLGVAYRDPHGLIWGQDGASHVNLAQAMSYCESIGARLPTREEFARLAKDLGAGTRAHYSCMTADKQNEVIPDLNDIWYWSSSLGGHGHHYNDIFHGYGGYIEPGNADSTGGSARCVIQE
jgi:hypothetical protein